MMFEQQKESWQAKLLQKYVQKKEGECFFNVVKRVFRQGGGNRQADSVFRNRIDLIVSNAAGFSITQVSDIRYWLIVTNFLLRMHGYRLELIGIRDISSDLSTILQGTRLAIFPNDFFTNNLEKSVLVRIREIFTIFHQNSLKEVNHVSTNTIIHQITQDSEFSIDFTCKCQYLAILSTLKLFSYCYMKFQRKIDRILQRMLANNSILFHLNSMNLNNHGTNSLISCPFSPFFCTIILIVSITFEM